MYRVIVCLFFIGIACAQYSKYQGTYQIDQTDTSDCENQQDYCCLGGTYVVSEGLVYDRLTVNGSYSQNSYPNCMSNGTPFSWIVEIYNAQNGQFRVVSGADSTLGPIDVYFTQSGQSYSSRIFFSQGFGSFNAIHLSQGQTTTSATSSSGGQTSGVGTLSVAAGVISVAAVINVIVSFM